MPTETITREDLAQKLLAAAERCVDKALDTVDGHEANLHASAAHTFVAAYEKLGLVDR